MNEAIGVVGRASAALAAQHVSGLDDLLRIPAVREALAWVEAKAGLTPAELLAKAGELATGIYGLLARFSGGVVKGLFDAVLTFLVTLFVLFFLLRDGREMVRALLDLVPLEEERRVAVLASLRGMLQSIFRGSLLCALIQGATGGIGWAIAGLPSPFLAGAAMAVLSLLPVGGTALVWGPGAIACWLQGRPGMAVFLAIWGLVVVSTLADNVLKPLLIGGTTELSTLVVFLGVFGGLGAFGLLGLFIGPMVLAFGLTLLADPPRDDAGGARRPSGGAGRRPDLRGPSRPRRRSSRSAFRCGGSSRTRAACRRARTSGSRRTSGCR